MPVTKVYANELCVLNSDRLDGERLRRIADAGNVADALKMLGDYGFCIADGTIDGFITKETNEFIAFIKENAASKSVADALIAPYEFNNVKLAYKSRFADMPADIYYATGTDVSGIALGEYDDLGGDLRAALERLDANKEKRPQIIDLEITRAMYKTALSCKTHAVRNYFRTEIDLKNILTAARMKRLGIDRDEFIDGGKAVKISALKEAVSGDDFSVCYEGTPYEEIGERLDMSRIAAFERDGDEFLFFMTDKMCQDMASYTPFINYYARVRIELKAIKTALVCVKMGSSDEFYARIPKLYD